MLCHYICRWTEKWWFLQGKAGGRVAPYSRAVLFSVLQELHPSNQSSLFVVHVPLSRGLQISIQGQAYRCSRQIYVHANHYVAKGKEVKKHVDISWDKDIVAAAVDGNVLPVKPEWYICSTCTGRCIQWTVFVPIILSTCYLWSLLNSHKCWNVEFK